MTTVAEAREALEKLASGSEGETQVSDAWLKGVAEFCKENGYDDPDVILGAIDKSLVGRLKSE